MYVGGVRTSLLQICASFQAIVRHVRWQNLLWRLEFQNRWRSKHNVACSHDLIYMIELPWWYLGPKSTGYSGNVKARKSKNATQQLIMQCTPRRECPTKVNDTAIYFWACKYMIWIPWWILHTKFTWLGCSRYYFPLPTPPQQNLRLARVLDLLDKACFQSGEDKSPDSLCKIKTPLLQDISFCEKTSSLFCVWTCMRSQNR